MNNKLVKVLEYLVNEEREKASDLLHDVFVEKAKSHWAALSEGDESVEDDIQDDEEDMDDMYDIEDMEDMDDYFGGDAEDDFLDDIRAAKSEIDSEEIYDDVDMDDEMPVDGEEMDVDMEFDMGEIEADDETPEPEEAMTNVEDAISELRAAFADLMADEDEDEMEDEMDDEDEEKMVAVGEAAKLHNVNVSHSEGSDSKASPMKGADNEMASPHPTDTSEGKGGSAPAVKDMKVTGPQEAGDPKPAPAPKREK